MSADWFVRWAVIAAITLIDSIWLRAKGIGFVAQPLVGPLIMTGLLLVSCLVFSLIAQKKESLSAVLLGTTDFFHSMIQSLLMVPPIVTLSYLAASLDRPVVDDFLAQADRFIGFDWTWVSIWMSSHPWLAATLTFTYTTIVWQPFLIMFLGSVNRPGYANSEFIWGFLLSALLTIAISGIVPAFGYEGVIGSPHINTLHAVREGAWTMLDIDRIDGIITFPSFHAAAGILFLYSVRHIRWALCILAPLNIAMILSTPTVGGHYLVDVIAGMVIASFSITLAGRLGARTMPRNMGWRAADGTGALGRSRQATESSGMSA